jgi:uncharacterized DUF497 family protein
MSKYLHIIWDLDDDPDGNVEHVLMHGVSQDEVEEILESENVDVSRSSGSPIAFGWTSTGRYLAVVFEEIDEDTARPVTAYDVDPP